MSMTGSIAANLHEGSRSEYLAQYVFTSFGTAFPVPHQEDSGLDLYCTLLEPQGKRAWPRASAGGEAPRRQQEFIAVLGSTALVGRSRGALPPPHGKEMV
jgi:hypothetical protein